MRSEECYSDGTTPHYSLLIAHFFNAILCFLFENTGNFGHKIFDVASTQRDQHIKSAFLHHIKNLFLMDEILLNAWTKTVVDELARHSRNRFFACRIDVAEEHFIEQRECIGKVLIEVTSTGIEMWLENRCYLLVGIEFTNGLHTLLYFLWMMAIIA